MSFRSGLLNCLAFIIIIMLCFNIAGCNKEASFPQVCTILSPKNNSKIIGGRILEITVLAKAENEAEIQIALFFDDEQIAILNAEPWHFSFNTEGYAYGKHQLKAQISDGSGSKSADEITIEIVPYAPPTHITDTRDGNVYETVEIGEQMWMKENLRYMHKHAQFVNNDNTNTPDYGYLYMTRIGSGQGICPEDWHIPTRNDWRILIDYLGGDSVAGGKLKEAGFERWKAPNTGATNESGFSARPAGSLSWDTIPEEFGRSARFFTSFYGTYKFIDFNSAEIKTIIYHPSSEFYSIRCVRDY